MSLDTLDSCPLQVKELAGIPSRRTAEVGSVKLQRRTTGSRHSLIACLPTVSLANSRVQLLQPNGQFVEVMVGRAYGGGRAAECRSVSRREIIRLYEWRRQRSAGL